MKKIYSCLLMILFSYTVFSQGIRKPKQFFPVAGTDNPSTIYNSNGGSGSRAIIFSEDFEAATAPALPTGWSTYDANPDGVGDTDPASDLFKTGDVTTANAGGFFPVPAHTKFAFTNDDACNCDKSSDFLQMPVLNLTGTTDYILKFAYVSDDEYGGISTVEASINGTAWISIATLPQTSGTYQWQNGSVNLTAYTGQATVYIRFKYNDIGTWDSGFTLDDVVVEDAPSIDAKLISGLVSPNQYPIMPISQVQPYSFGGIITNVGSTAFTGANVSVNVNSGAYTANANSGTLNPGDTATVAIPGTFTPTAPGAYVAAFNVTLTGDANLANNIDTVRFTVSDSVMARERGTSLFFLNIDTVKYAQRFDVYNTDTLTSASFFLYKPKVGDTVYVTIHNFAGGIPTTQLAQSVKYAITAADTGATGAFKTLRFITCGPLILTPGSYAMVFHNRVQYSAGMLISTAFYNPGTSLFTNDNGITWNDVAAIAPSSFVMRANFGSTTTTAITVTTTATNITCNGANNGTATATASGGTGTLTYAWSNGDTGTMADSLAAGTYTVTVTDANGCTKTATGTITEPAVLTATATSTQATCGSNNGTATVVATGGTTPYTFMWSNAATDATATNLAVGTYTVTVTDNNGCTKTASTTVTNPGAPTVTITPASATICAGNSATLTASGATTYSWSNGATTAAITVSPTTPTTYTVTGTTAGCSGTDNATVTVNSLPATPTITQSGFVLTSSAATGNQWNLNGTPISGATAQSHTATANGNYTVTVTNANNCSATSAITNVTGVGITEVATISSVIIYPNPASTQATLAYELAASSNVSLKVFDVTGKEVINIAEGNKAVGKHLVNIDTQNLNSGVYYYSLTVDGNNLTKKLVIVK